MRNLIFGINLSLDGCCDHTKITPYEDVHEYFTKLLRDADTLVYGRITYQLMVPFWPDMAKNDSAPTEALKEFAQAFNAIEKIVVFSRTLEKAEGKNTQIVRGSLRDEILKLKQEPGKNIMIGGVDIPSQVMELDLIDEYHFVVQPKLIGEGRRLLEAVHLQKDLSLELAGSTAYPSGCIALRYMKK